MILMHMSSVYWVSVLWHVPQNLTIAFTKAQSAKLFKGKVDLTVCRQKSFIEANATCQVFEKEAVISDLSSANLDDLKTLLLMGYGRTDRNMGCFWSRGNYR